MYQQQRGCAQPFGGAGLAAIALRVLGLSVRGCMACVWLRGLTFMVLTAAAALFQLDVKEAMVIGA